MEILQTLNFLLFRSRTFLSLVAGAVAGVLGLTGISGFLFYLIVMAAQSGTLLLKAKLNARAYFLSLQAVVFDGVLPNVLVSARNKGVLCLHMLLSSGPICSGCSKSCAKWVAMQSMQPAWGPKRVIFPSMTFMTQSYSNCALACESVTAHTRFLHKLTTLCFALQLYVLFWTLIYDYVHIF
jgi:hypothetical protein